MKIVGRWKDRCCKNGRWYDGEHGKFEWDFNQIQNTFATLLTCWLREEAGYNRIGYMGIGSGLIGWDTSPPAQPYSQTALTTEYARMTIAQVDLVFIDPATDLPTGGTPSSKIEITVNMGAGDANGTMREFGLFGGTATAALDSGEMVNWVVHNKIIKSPAISIQRKVRIEFQTN